MPDRMLAQQAQRCACCRVLPGGARLLSSACSERQTLSGGAWVMSFPEEGAKKGGPKRCKTRRAATSVRAGRSACRPEHVVRSICCGSFACVSCASAPHALVRACDSSRVTPPVFRASALNAQPPRRAATTRKSSQGATVQAGCWPASAAVSRWREGFKYGIVSCGVCCRGQPQGSVVHVKCDRSQGRRTTASAPALRH